MKKIETGLLLLTEEIHIQIENGIKLLEIIPVNNKYVRILMPLSNSNYQQRKNWQTEPSADYFFEKSGDRTEYLKYMRIFWMIIKN